MLEALEWPLLEPNRLRVHESAGIDVELRLDALRQVEALAGLAMAAQHKARLGVHVLDEVHELPAVAVAGIAVDGGELHLDPDRLGLAGVLHRHLAVAPLQLAA